MGRTTEIDWCDSTWNPVTGCRHECGYCYARSISHRFSGGVVHGEKKRKDGLHDLACPAMILRGGKHMVAPYPYDFEPTFHRYKLDEPKKWKKPKNIFVVSMGDLFGDWVPDEWITEVLDSCVEAPQHRYLFLSKNPQRIMQYEDKHPLMTPDRENFWYGTTVTANADYERVFDLINWHDYNGANTFVSVEPLLGPIWKNGRERIAQSQWVIIGAETGNRRGKVSAQREWVDNIVNDCTKLGTPVFMKSSLEALMGPDFRQEFPWEVNQ